MPRQRLTSVATERRRRMTGWANPDTSGRSTHERHELIRFRQKQSPAAPERVGLRGGRPRPQHAPHQRREDVPRQPLAAIRPPTVRQRRAEQLGEVLGQGPRPLHDMIGQRGQHVGQRDARCAPPAARDRWQGRRTDHVAPRAKKVRAGRGRATHNSTMRLGRWAHSQDTYSHFNCCTRKISHQRISERHCYEMRFPCSGQR